VKDAKLLRNQPIPKQFDPGRLKYINLYFHPVVLYECKTLSPTLREDWRFENKVLRRLFRPKRDEIIGS
jgi:hypothetical protein